MFLFMKQWLGLSLHISHVWTELLLLDETFSSLFYLDLQLNVSMVTIRLGLVRDIVHNSSLLLRQPVKALQSLSNGKRTDMRDVLTHWSIETVILIQYWYSCLSGSSEALQQTQIKAVAAHSKLQEAMQRLQRLRAQLKDSSSLVENANNTLRETSQLVTLTHTAGLSLRFYANELVS